jgi:single-strand DNA-binding protein
MNMAIICGRLTKDPDVRWTQGENSMQIARYSIAVDRRGKDKQTDFINCVAFNKSAKFAEDYFHKGMRVLVTGRIQTGSYKDKEGRTVYTTDIIVDNQEFADGKAGPGTGNSQNSGGIQPDPVDEFMAIPESEEDALPFN